MLDAGALIEKHRRTQNFTIEDFDLLSRLISSFGKLVTTPHVLSQVSDLTDLPGKDLRTIRGLFGTLVEQMEEVYDPTRVLVTHDLFSRLGLTDAAIATVCSKGILVLTTDLNLQLALQQRGAEALNFNHVRPLGWT
jgi:hypothetical protein